MIEDGKVPERYFYHSFPRRMRNSEGEVAAACEILAVIRDYGLLLTPQVVSWDYEHVDGAPARTGGVLQQRACFTELEPRELSGHAEKFGRFALEFTVPTLKSLGAVPVFYVPRALEKAAGAEGAAATLVMQLIDATILLTRIQSVMATIKDGNLNTGPFSCTFGFNETGNQTFDLDVGEITRVLGAFTHAITPPDILLPGLEGMLKFFAPADDVKHGEALGYYREREWRIAGNPAIRGVEMMRRPSPELIKRLLSLDSDFFGRRCRPDSDRTQAEESYVLPGLDDVHILRMVNRIIAPEAAISDLHKILAGFEGGPAIVALETLPKNCKGQL